MNNTRRIQFTNGNVTEYVYSAEGEKRCTDKVLFSGGFCSFTDSNQPVFHYYTQDHLGNNRAVVNENGTLEQVTHYYPFGGVYGDTGLNASAQPYKYNGKELDRMHGLDWYDYGARQYDAALAQWTKMDPLCETYKGFNPYAYCGNNPINAVDPDGCNPVYNSFGKFLGNSNEGFTGIIYVYSGSEKIDFSKQSMNYWTNPDREGSSDFRTYDSFESSLNGDDKANYVSNVMTDIAKQLSGTKLWDKTFTINSLQDSKIGFSEDDRSNFTTTAKHTENGSFKKIKIVAHGDTYKSYEGSVENFACSILIHEWYSHGEYFVGNHHLDANGRPDPNHRKAYENVKRDTIFYPKTTSSYKKFIDYMLDKYINK